MRKLRNHPGSLRSDRRGGALIEFALVFPVFILLSVGGIYVALLSFASANLQKAVKEGARCYSINTTTCSSTATTEAYARTRYVSVTNDTPVFAASLATCGHLVNGSMSFTFNTGLAKFNIPLTSQACYP